MEKQKLAKPMPNPINRGRGRIARLRGPRNLQKLGAHLEQQLEVLNSAMLVQPTEPYLLAGTFIVSEKEEMMPSGAPLQSCCSAQLLLINSPTESSATPSTCTEPLRGDNGVISEKPGASQEQRRINPHPLPGGGQCSSEDITKSYTMLSGGVVQNDSGACLNSEDMSRAQLRVLETTVQLQPNIVIVSGLLAVNPSMGKQKPAKPMPNLINRGRGRIGRLRGPRNLQKLEAQMNAALQSGIHYFHRPVTRSQAKLFTNTSMFPEEAAQEKPMSKADVLCNGSEQIPDLDMGTFLASDSEKMMLGGRTSVETMQVESLAQINATLQSGIHNFHRPVTKSNLPEEAAQQKPISEGDVQCSGSEQNPDLDMGTFLVSDSKKMMLGGDSSVGAMQVESSGENPDWLRTHSNLEENVVISGTQIEDIVAGASGGSVSKTSENSGIHLDLQPTELQSQTNTSHCENDCQNDADLSGMMSQTSLLQTIYTKYGNITQGSHKSETFKKRCLLRICGVIQKLQVTSIDDISSDDMAELYSTVKDAENMKLDMKWLHQRLDEIEESMRSRDKRKTMEEAKGAITLEEENLQKRLAMNKLKIARLEHEIEMLREEQTAKRSRCEEVKAWTENIKSSYNSCPKSLIDWLL